MKKSAFVIFFVLIAQSWLFSQSIGNNPLDSLIVIEAENCTDPNGIPASGPRGTTSPVLFFNSHPSASGKGFISSYPGPFRTFSDLKQPAIATTTIEIPESGTWYVHVRYFVTPETIRKLLSSPKPPGHFRFFKPFKVGIGNSEFICGENQQPGEEFRWDIFSLNLNAGKTQLKLIMNDLSGPDCVVLTKVADYRPQPTDYEGPLWFRFRVLKAPAREFYIHCRISFNPYESKTPLNAGWIFKDIVAGSQQELNELKKSPDNLCVSGNWSPWIKTVNPKRPYCTMHVMVMPADFRAFPDARRAGLNNVELIFQAATRPDENFIIHQGSESSGPARGIYILLPHEPGLAGMRKWTKSFSEWAEERLNLVRQTGAKPDQGPEKIQVFTDARATVEKDIEAIIESCRLAGFNGFDLDQNLISETDLWKKIEQAGFNWTVAHHLMLINPDFKEIEKRLVEGKSVQNVINQYWYEMVKQRIEKIWGSRSQTRRKMLDLAILADEPNPQPHYLFIRHIPVLRACFHGFLKNNGLKPEFFGKNNWDEIDAAGYANRASSTIEKLLENYGIKVLWKQTAETEKDQEIERATDTISEDQKQEKGPEKNLKTIEVNVHRGLVKASDQEKKLYYWTQKFRSFYTAQIYGTGTKVVKDMAKNGFFKMDIKISPNFQAAPMMETRMWDGALNLFEWAQNNTTNFLLCEDWINDPYRVAFGFSLLSAAARKNNQQLGYLIVVDRNFRRRYLAGLANGVKLFVDYSYGPLITKGPAWSSSPEYTNDWCQMLRWTKKCEDDIVGTEMRKSDAALLIANSSEICSAFYSATNYETGLAGRAFGSRPLFRRAGIFTALLDAGIPVEIVSEEEILQDNILDRYKVLYAVDTHVREDVQKKIRQWVNNGGTIWTDYLALARNEYDRDTVILNDVFGISNRGFLPDPAKDPQPEAKTIRVLNTGGFESVSFTGSLFKPDWKLSTARPIAVFEDGSPAVVYNKYGKGNAIIVGCSALIFSPYSIQYSTHPEFDKVRKIVSFAADLGKVKKHCEISVSGINSFVREGEKQMVLFLINSTGKDQNFNVKLDCDKKIVSAFDAKDNKINFIQNGNEVIFPRSIKENDGDICVLRW